MKPTLLSTWYRESSGAIRVLAPRHVLAGAVRTTSKADKRPSGTQVQEARRYR
jgi:hypothetical protein